jgi:hypothetical protein
MSLATSCLVANLQIGVAAGTHKAIIAAGAKLRYHFYVNTLEWKTSGDRLLPCKNFVPFIGGHLALKKEFAGLLAGLDMAAIEKFYVRLDIDPLTEPTHYVDLNFDLSVEMEARVQRIIEKAMKVRKARATEDLWSRLIDPLTHFAQKMESGETFRDATVRNLVEAIELLPRLNFVDDEGVLANMIEDTEIHLRGVKPKLLRTNIGGYRETVAREARRILNEIERIRA